MKFISLLSYSLRILPVISLMVLPPPCFSQNSQPPVIVNVLDFGAIPNDDGDDTAAFQAAIDFAIDSKFKYLLDTYYFSSKTIHVPEGIYLVTGLVIRPNYVRMTGAGSQSTVIKLVGGSGPVVHLKGSSYAELEKFTIDGAGVASYGVLAEDIGYVPEDKGDFPSVHGTLNNIIIRGVRGQPGIGFANTDRAHSWRIIDSTISENNIGIKLIRRAQHSAIIESSILGNYQQQLVLGDGYHFLRDISIRDTNVEGRNSTQGELIRVDGVEPLNMNAVYFEGHRAQESVDILTVNLPSIVNLNRVYSNGGASDKPLRSILLRTNTNLSIEGGSFINSQKVYEIGTAEGDIQYAKPEESRILIKNCRGPGIKRGLELRQGGQT